MRHPLYARENQNQCMLCSQRGVDECNSGRMNKGSSLQSICLALGIAVAPSREAPSTAETGGVLKDNVSSGYEGIIGVQNDLDVDPIYKLFLDHLREDENSYVLEMMDRELGSSILIKYEGENGLIDKSEARTQKTSKCAAYRHDQTNEVTHVRGISSSKRPVQDAPLVSGSQFKMESPVDDNYQKFLSCVRLQHGSMVLEWGSGISVRYEENETSAPFAGLSTEGTLCSSGQELIPYESSPQHCVSQSGVEEDDRGCIVPYSCNDTFQYKEKLLEVLSAPYDQNEYAELLKEATERKPLTKFKHLRGMSISYATKEKGLSYLDHHPDLAIQIEGADCQTALTLLRGFFFWLKNLSHEGAFMPWKSPPESSEMLTNDCELVLPLDCVTEEV